MTQQGTRERFHKEALLRGPDLRATDVVFDESWLCPTNVLAFSAFQKPSLPVRVSIQTGKRAVDEHMKFSQTEKPISSEGERNARKKKSAEGKAFYLKGFLMEIEQGHSSKYLALSPLTVF